MLSITHESSGRKCDSCSGTAKVVYRIEETGVEFLSCSRHREQRLEKALKFHREATAPKKPPLVKGGQGRSDEEAVDAGVNGTIALVGIMMIVGVGLAALLT